MNTFLKKYTIFETNAGFFGLAGQAKSLAKTTLPVRSRSAAKELLLCDFGPADYDQGYFGSLQKDIKSYFKGTYAGNFENTPLVLDGFSDFAIKILTACRSVTSGQTITYKKLASLAGFSGAFRAAGSVLAKNPLPLMIPCHRIIKSDGSIGRFTAPGGTKQKQSLLLLEKQILHKE